MADVFVASAMRTLTGVGAGMRGEERRERERLEVVVCLMILD